LSILLSTRVISSLLAVHLSSVVVREKPLRNLLLPLLVIILS